MALLISLRRLIMTGWSATDGWARKFELRGSNAIQRAEAVLKALRALLKGFLQSRFQKSLALLFRSINSY